MTDDTTDEKAVQEWLAAADAFRKRTGPLPGPSSTELLRVDRDRDEERFAHLLKPK